jgi:hypothetical protein
MCVLDLSKKLKKLYNKQTKQNLKGKFKKARRTELKIIKLLLKVRGSVL